MTPQQKIRHLILIRHEEFGDDPDTIEFAKGLDAAGIDEQWSALEYAEDGYELWDAINEVREGDVVTDIPSESNRHLETKSVAARYLDGSWVGWTYWYGGGKHAEPEAVEWIPYAYALDVTEEEKMVTVRTFAKQESPA